MMGKSGCIDIVRSKYFSTDFQRMLWMTFSEGVKLWESVDDKALPLLKVLVETQNVNFRGEFAQVPLHRAAVRLFPEAMQLLINFGADASATDVYERTEMHCVKPGEEESLQCLLLLAASGTDIHAKDNTRMTDLQANIQQRTIKNEEYILDVEFLLELGATVDPRDHSGMTPLGLTAKHGLYNVAKQLIREGADTNTCDQFGNTPIFLNQDNNPDRKYLELLVRYGADVNTCNHLGETPLHHAVRRGGDTSVLNWIKVLLKNDADVHARDIYGQTPLELASLLPSTEVANILSMYL